MCRERGNTEVRRVGVLLMALALSGPALSAAECPDLQTATPASGRVVLAQPESANPDPPPSPDPLSAAVVDPNNENEPTASSATRGDAPISLPPRVGPEGSSTLGGRSLPPGPRLVPWYRHGLVALSVVLGVIFGLLWLLRRYVPSVRKAPAGPLRVVARTAISPKQSVALLEVGRRYVLVGITADHLTNLGHIQDPDESFHLRAKALEPRPAGRQNRFDELLSQEAAEYAEVESAVPAAGPPSREQLQDTMGQLRTLLGRLRSLQEPPAR